MFFDFGFVYFAKAKGTIGVNEHAPLHGFTPQEHALPHGVSVGEGNFDGLSLPAKQQRSLNHETLFLLSAGAFDTSSVHHTPAVALDDFAVFLDGVDVKVDELLPVFFKGLQIEGVQWFLPRSRCVP